MFLSTECVSFNNLSSQIPMLSATCPPMPSIHLSTPFSVGQWPWNLVRESPVECLIKCRWLGLDPQEAATQTVQYHILRNLALNFSPQNNYPRSLPPCRFLSQRFQHYPAILDSLCPWPLTIETSIPRSSSPAPSHLLFPCFFISILLSWKKILLEKGKLKSTYCKQNYIRSASQLMHYSSFIAGFRVLALRSWSSPLGLHLGIVTF